MMYLGRNSYFLDNPEGMADALLVAHLMASPGPNGQPLVKDWQRLMEITTFYAGPPDDIGYPEWRNFVVKALGTSKFSPAEALEAGGPGQNFPTIGGTEAAQDFVRRHHQRGVPDQTKQELLAGAKAFRIFGQRFTFDGWVLGRLTAGEEKAAVRLPSTPTALFVPAASGR